MFATERVEKLVLARLQRTTRAFGDDMKASSEAQQVLVTMVGGCAEVAHSWLRGGAGAYQGCSAGGGRHDGVRG